MAQKLIVVIGATGNQGGSVVDTFSALPGWKVRGVTRNVNSLASKSLSTKGIEMVKGDLDDVESLISAFQGANVIFSATDFWQPFFDPASASKVGPDQTLLEWVHDYELQRCKNIFAAADSIKDSGLERLIFSALSYATKWSGGKYTHVYHFDSEARAVEYAEKTYPKLMEKTSLIQLGMFLTNFLYMPHYQPARDSDGVYVFRSKLRADRKLPLVVAHEDTGPLTKTLVDNEPKKHLLAYRGWMSLNELAETWGRALGLKARYEALAPESERGDLMEALRFDIEDAAAYLSEFGYDGGDPSVVHPAHINAANQLSTVQDWIQKQDWNAVLQRKLSQ